MEEVARALNEMEGAGIKKNTIVYNAAVQACQRGGAWKEAVQLADAIDRKSVV